MAKTPKKASRKEMANDDGRAQKSLYLPNWIWKKLAEEGKPQKHSYSNTVELILEEKFK